MDDALLASRAAAGDLDSFGQLYDRYFVRVYDFAWRTLSDPADAVAATEDAFSRTTQALASPGNAPTFRALLFAQAHRAVLERADAPTDGRTGPAHEEAFGAFDAPDPAHVENPSSVRGDYELAVLAWEGLASLTSRDYALLDLHLRQGLSAAEIAHVLGTSKKEAQTVLTRMTSAAGGVLESYVLARRSSCPQLREALAPFAIPPLEEDARGIAQSHIASCDLCQRDRQQLPPMLDVMAAFTAIAAPHALKGDVWSNIASSWRIAPASVETTLFDDQPYDEVAESPYKPLPGGADGAPPYYPRARAVGGETEWTRNKIVIFAAAAIGFLVFAFAGGAVITGAFGGGDDGAAVGSDSTATASDPGVSTPNPATSTTPGVSVETPTEDPNATETPAETPTATAAPEEDTPTPTPPPAPQATATTAPQESPTAAPPPPNATPTRGALIPIGTPQGQ